ncbi:hypothetical protein AB0V79_27725 [Mesorhizobium ciceri]|uniref:hypothetical protein n=1 Tax=Mesorhizobium TaxID=68287 RepID=UPI000ABF5A31|nr:hypothetical protein [Mesorhizobium ciceri]
MFSGNENIPTLRRQKVTLLILGKIAEKIFGGFVNYRDRLDDFAPRGRPAACSTLVKKYRRPTYIVRPRPMPSNRKGVPAGLPAP